MKILVEGSLPSEKIYTCTCRKCSTKFEFKRAEGKEHFDQRDGNSISVICPLPGCGYENWVAL